RLTNFWENNTPPERCERWADFMEKSHEPSYASTRLIGQLFRRVKVIDDSVKLMIMESEQVTIPQDPLIDYPGWERWEKETITEYETYSAHLQVYFFITSLLYMFAIRIKKLCFP
uniref:RNA-directed RNA polymerase n=1 Tax=Acrobeloides nanus TaxID=290746 RepID=A0A914DMZ6_9BILA